ARRYSRDFHGIGAAYLAHDELSYPIAAVQGDGGARKIDQNHLQLTAVVGVDRPRRIEAGDPLLQSKAGARADLRFESRRQLEGPAGRNRATLERLENQVPFDVRAQVHPSGDGAVVARNRQRIRRPASPLQLDGQRLQGPAHLPRTRCGTNASRSGITIWRAQPAAEIPAPPAPARARFPARAK